MIHTGEKVKIGFTGAVYTTYLDFLNYYREVSTSSLIERVCSQYELGRAPTITEARDTVFTVMFVREHGSMEGKKLAIINDGNITFIIDINALTVVSSNMPFLEGDRVCITDSGGIYSSWRELVKHAITVIPDGGAVYHKWVYAQTPTAEEIDHQSPESIFTVKWVGHHISRPDDGILAIISNDKNTYIINTNGLAKAGEKSWDKYIIYVRNWAVVNKDTAQSVMDATGPKSYAQWLSDKS